MSERCADCRFWDRYIDQGELSATKGDCRRRPPLINDRVLQHRMPGRCIGDWDEMVLDLYVASAFPITHETSWCGEYENPRAGAPLC